MTNTREERVARAICKANFLSDGYSEETANRALEDGVWRNFLPEARAAIVAYEVEPSPDVWEATLATFEPFVPYLEEWMKDEAEWPDHKQASVFRTATFGQIRKARAMLPDPPKVTVEEDRA